jgi:hypothetical protein
MAVEQNIPSTVYARRLIAEIATLMQAKYTFQEIADRFYEVNVIDKPERPYGSFDGNKRDYVIQRLGEAKDVELFFRMTVPGVIADCEEEHDIHRSLWAMRHLGYRLTEDGERYGVNDWEAPAALPSIGGGDPSPAAATGKRIDLPDLPSSVQTLLNELEDNLDRRNLHAAALLTRSITHRAVFIAMHQRGKEASLKTEKGNDVDLSVAIARCQQEFGLSNQVVSRITSAKWIGDSANHSFRVKANEADLDRCVTGLRLFLQEIL